MDVTNFLLAEGASSSTVNNDVIKPLVKLRQSNQHQFSSGWDKEKSFLEQMFLRLKFSDSFQSYD
jgi:hypothetical protein